MAKQEINNWLLRDTVEVYLKDNSDNEYFFGLTTAGTVTKNANKTLIKAGIGGKVVATLSTEDGYEISVESGLFINEITGIQLGQVALPENVTLMETGLDEQGMTTAVEKTAKGYAIDLGYGQFPKTMAMQLRTIAYDRNTNEKIADVYWIFDKVQPDANFSQAFNMDTNNVQSVVFNAIATDGSTSYGKYVVVPVDQDSITVPVTP